MTGWERMDEAVAYGRTLWQGERVQLRTMTSADIEATIPWWLDPAWAVLQQNQLRPQNPDEARELLTRWGRGADASGCGFSIVTHDGEFVGHFTLYGAKLPVRCATFAIQIAPEHVGRGYGSDASRLALRYAFDELGLNRVELRAWAFNERAIAAYRKAGFVEEGRRRSVGFHEGRFQDEVLMAVLAEEWRATRASEVAP
jgi:RimJ/RimL family protein N-acetyltransferase